MTWCLGGTNSREAEGQGADLTHSVGVFNEYARSRNPRLGSDSVHYTAEYQKMVASSVIFCT
jgi:hypothetical protein